MAAGAPDLPAGAAPVRSRSRFGSGSHSEKAIPGIANSILLSLSAAASVIKCAQPNSVRRGALPIPAAFAARRETVRSHGKREECSANIRSLHERGQDEA